MRLSHLAPAVVGALFGLSSTSVAQYLVEEVTFVGPTSSIPANNNYQAFGYSVAVRGSILAIGMPGGDPNDVKNAGIVNVYEKVAGTWQFAEVLFHPTLDLRPDDNIGRSVSIYGNTLIAGAESDEPNGQTLSGNTGSAYVFVRDPGTGVWSQEAQLVARNPVPFEGLGWSVDLWEDTAVVGAWYFPNSPTTPLTTGAVFIFDRTGTSWSQTAKLVGSDSADGDEFGRSVSIHEDTVIVGAPGVDYQPAVGSAEPNAGAVYVFSRQSTSWTEDSKHFASVISAGDSFGHSVSADSGTLLAGAPNGTAAYVFVETAGAWSEQAVLSPSVSPVGSAFGVSVDLSGSLAVVGAETSGGRGTEYVFERAGLTWSEYKTMPPSCDTSPDALGFSVAIDGTTVVVGAPQHGTPGASGYAVVLQATPGDFSSHCFGSGTSPTCTPCPCGNSPASCEIGGCLNSAGSSAQLLASGETSVSLPSNVMADLRLALTGAPPLAFCILNSGDAVAPTNPANPCFGLNSGTQAMQFDGLRCAVMNTRRHGGRSANANGDIGVNGAGSPWGGEGGPPVGIANAGSGFVPGQTRYFQVINRDDPLLSCMRGLNTSQAVEVTFTP